MLKKNLSTRTVKGGIYILLVNRNWMQANIFGSVRFISRLDGGEPDRTDIFFLLCLNSELDRTVYL